MDNVYHIPENEQMMDEIYAVLSLDDKGEGICSMMTNEGAFPMVFGHPRMLDMIKPVIRDMAMKTNRTMRIVKFKKMEVMETFE